MVHDNLLLERFCQAVNGCAAQHSGQVLMFEGKSRSHFKSFTTFSKSVFMHKACLLLFLHRYNRERAILLK